MASFPAPKSPPDYPHFYGKRQQMVKVQVLEREIAILEEEIKSLDGVPLASSCCKELDDFVEAKTDPLVEINEETAKSNCFQKRPRQKSRRRCSWICCFCCPSVGKARRCSSCCESSEDGSSCCCLRCSSCLKSCSLKLLFCPCCSSCCVSKSFCKKVKRCCCCCCSKSCCGPCLLCH